MAENAQQEKPKGGGNGKLIGTALILLPAIAVLMPSCIVLMVMMVPTIVIYALDRTREKYFAITVGLLNVCGAMPAEVHLWQRGQTYDAAFDIVGDPFYWLMAYGAASVGWVIYLGLPPIFSHAAPDSRPPSVAPSRNASRNDASFGTSRLSGIGSHPRASKP